MKLLSSKCDVCVETCFYMHELTCINSSIFVCSGVSEPAPELVFFMQLNSVLGSVPWWGWNVKNLILRYCAVPSGASLKADEIQPCFSLVPFRPYEQD